MAVGQQAFWANPAPFAGAFFGSRGRQQSLTVSFGHVSSSLGAPTYLQGGDEFATAPSLSSAPGDLLFIVLARSAAVRVEGEGRHIRLQPGQWILCTHARFDDAADPRDRLLISVSRQAIDGGIDIDRCMMKVMGDRDGAAQLLPMHLISLCAGEAGRVACGSEMAEIAIHMVRVALMDLLRAISPIPMRETLRSQIKAYIARNLRDPELAIDHIAARFKCTKRNLHKVFRDEGSTLSKYLWNARVEKCRMDLTDALMAHRSITEIAFSWGFNNSAHFSRTFRARYDLSPSAYRIRALAAAAAPLGADAPW